MDCQNPVTHVIRSGDTLYNIARRYNTSVQTLLADNKHLNTYNLRIGGEILVCPGEMGTYLRSENMIEGVKYIQRNPNFFQAQQMRTNMPPSVRLPENPAPSSVPPVSVPGPMMKNPAMASMPKIPVMMPTTPAFSALMQDVHSLRPNTTDNDPADHDPAQLSKKMRELWMEHILWTRMVIITILDSLGENEAATMRLLRNPGDMARVFEPFYGNAAANQIEMLFTKHLTIADQLVRALKRSDTNAVDQYSKQWEDNAIELANFFNKLNPYFRREDLLAMLESHLDLTKREAGFYATKQYDEDVANFDDIEKQAMHMADFFTQGLLEQFASRMR